MQEDEILKLCDTIRNIAYNIHVYLGQGHLKKVYENALKHRLRKANINFSEDTPITVYDEDGTIIGQYFAVIVVENILMIETRTVKTITNEHTASILGLLRASDFEHALVFNFGSFKFEARKLKLLKSKLNLEQSAGK